MKILWYGQNFEIDLKNECIVKTKEPILSISENVLDTGNKSLPLFWLNLVC